MFNLHKWGGERPCRYWENQCMPVCICPMPQIHLGGGRRRGRAGTHQDSDDTPLRISKHTQKPPREHVTLPPGNFITSVGTILQVRSKILVKQGKREREREISPYHHRKTDEKVYTLPQLYKRNSARDFECYWEGEEESMLWMPLCSTASGRMRESYCDRESGSVASSSRSRNSSLLILPSLLVSASLSIRFACPLPGPLHMSRGGNFLLDAESAFRGCLQTRSSSLSRLPHLSTLPFIAPARVVPGRYSSM